MNDLSDPLLAPLPHLATIVVTGTDARSYLQGQLSFDMDRVGSDKPELACLNSPQGRVQAVVWLIERQDSIVLLLPTSMVDPTLARLKKYVLRAKVRLASGAGSLDAYAARLAMPDALAGERIGQAITAINWPGVRSRALVLTAPGAVTAVDPSLEHDWRLADIRAGIAQVYPQTHELFVAQMLNLDLLGGISFDKGCYTGQEIIARTHYRGTIKRRMFRFAANAIPPAPATRILSGEAHAGDVVDSVATQDGCEFLAVISVAQLDEPLHLETTPDVALERLELPYPVSLPAGEQTG
jgi:folate-binding protein YgfZ